MTDIKELRQRVTKLEKWSHEPQPVLSPKEFDQTMQSVYKALNDMRDRIESLEGLMGYES